MAQRLYALLSCGHRGLPFSVDQRGLSVSTVGTDGARVPVPGSRPPAGGWLLSRELRYDAEQSQWIEAPRGFNAAVLEQHLLGAYSVAPYAPAWVQWAALDIDAHPDPGPELVGRRLAKARADRVLAAVWRAFRCSADRQPLVLRSPGGGYHLWFPLTRGAGAQNAEHTWPASLVRAWFERHLVAAGVPIGLGTLEVFPSGRGLRAPCGLGMQMLQATRPSDAESLGLVPWPGTIGPDRIDWRSTSAALSSPLTSARRIVPLVQAFVAQWDVQRRSLADWLGRPAAAWHEKYGFLGWREKNVGDSAAEISYPSQESDDAPTGLHAGGARSGSTPGGRHGASNGAGAANDQNIIPTALVDDTPQANAAGPLVRGRAFKTKVRRLLEHGVTEPRTRFDGVRTLVFYWGATCGKTRSEVLALLEAWCEAHTHSGSRLSCRPRRFRGECLREGAHYLTHHGPRWRFRARGDGGGLATLVAADQIVVQRARYIKPEVATILAWLAARADKDGVVAHPVQISSGLLARLCGDRRVVVGEQRRRATTIAIEELESLGVLTLAREYAVGRRGRIWSCWYRFGSGRLPERVELPAAEWAGLTDMPQNATACPESEAITVRVVAERTAANSVVRVLSDGSRVPPRTAVKASLDVPAWVLRMFRRPYTPGELVAPSVPILIPFPDLEAWRRLPRRMRVPGAGGEPVGGKGKLPEQVVPLTVAHPPEVGEMLERLPIAIADVAAQAWRSYRPPK